MKKFLLLLIVHSTLCIVNCYSQQYGWVSMPLPDSTVNNISRIYIEGTKTWLLADSSIYYSPNYPEQQLYKIYTTPPEWRAILNSWDFVLEDGKRYGWVVGSESYGVKSIDDSALVWSGGYIGGENNHLVTFVNKNVGYFTSTDRYLSKTTNGGFTWIEIYGPLTVSSVNGLIFLDTLTGYFTGSAPAFKKTTDGGLNWFNNISVTGSMVDIFFLNENLGWAIGVNDILIYSNSTWNRIANSVLGLADISIFFVDELNGWRAGFNGKIMHTTDGGYTWLEQTSGATGTLKDLYFTSPTNGYAVGFGTILHYTLLTDIEQQPTQPTEFKLEQNYPNPFNPSTSIQYAIGSTQLVQLKVYDVLGNEIATLVNEEKAAGIYNVQFTMNNLSTGIYFYKLTAGEYVSTKKMILIK